MAKHVLALLGLSLTLPASADQPDTAYDCTPTVYNATATWYDNGPLGLSACHYSDPTLPGGPTKATQYYAAVASHMYDDNTCGACAEITDTSNGNKITVMITDECPAASNPTHCSSGSNHLDISQNAFDDLRPLVTGVFNITWKVVPCPNNFLNVKGQNGANLTYQFKSGASSGWATLIIRDYIMPIESVSYCTGSGTGCQPAAWQRPYNGWVPSGGPWNTFYLRITDKGGNVQNFGPISCCTPMGTDAKTETSAVYGNIPGGQMPGCGPAASPTRTPVVASYTNTPNWTKTITPTVTLTPDFISRTIYDGESAARDVANDGVPGSYAGGYQGGGGPAAVSDQTTTVYAGSKSMLAHLATTTGGYAGIYWQFAPAADSRAVDSSPYDTVEFYVRSAAGGGNFTMSFYDTGGTLGSPMVSVMPYVPGGTITTAWQLVSVPLSLFNLGLGGSAAWKASVGRLTLEANGTSGAPAFFTYDIYIDELRFVKRPASPTPSFSPTRTRTSSPSATATRTATRSATPSSTASSTRSATRTRSATPSTTPSRTATPLSSPSFTRTETALAPSDTASPTFTPSSTRTSTRTATPTATAAAPTSSSTPSATRTGTRTASPSSTPSATRTATRSASPSSTPSATRTASGTSTPAYSSTSTPTFTPFAGSPTSSHTFSHTPSRSPSPTSSRTFSPTSSPTATSLVPSATSSATQTSLPPSPTATPSATATPAASLTFTPTSTPTSTPSTVQSPTATSSHTPFAGSPTRTHTPSATPSSSPVYSPSFTATPTATPSSSPPASLTRTPTATPSSTVPAPPATLSATPTATRTATVTLTRTPSATPTATRSATPANTAADTPSPTPSATSAVSAPTLTSTPDMGGPNVIEVHLPRPNPNPSHLAARLKGGVDEVVVKVYTKSMVCLGSSRLGSRGKGWCQVPLPAELAAAPAGLYYYRLSTLRGGVESLEPGIGSLMLLR